MMKRVFLIAVGLSFLFLAWDWHAAYAEGPGTGGRKIKLDQEPAGPYLVRVIISPTPPRVENTYLEIRVIEPATDAIITDADVTVRAVSGEAFVEAIASHAIAPIPDEFAAHLPIPFPEVWEFTVTVESSLGRGEVNFLERISKPNSIAPLLSVGVPIIGLLILGVVFYRLQRSADQEKLPQSSPR